MYPPKDDIVFQALFKKGNERITIALIEAITNEKIKKINLEKDKNLLRTYRNEKGGRLDFKAILNDGEICHIDIQVKEKGNEDKRFLQYWSKIYSRQLEQGEDYENLKKVISIIILNYRFNKTEEIKDMITKWKIKEEKYGKICLTEDFEMFIIEIPKVKDVLKKEPKNKLAQWMMFFDNPEKKEVSEIMKTNKEIEEAMKKLQEINSDAELKRIIQIRERNELERLTDLHEARNKGIEQGIKQGREVERQSVAKEMKKKGLSIDLIEEVTKLTKEEIEKL